MSNTEQRLENLVAEILEIEREALKDKKDLNFFKELGVDSLLGLELVAAVEREFDIKIEDEEVISLVTFNAVIELTNKKLSAKK